MSIVIDRLTKAYRNQIVLRDICAEFQEKRIHGIVGRNGSGKSVLFRCICGYTRPSSGCIYIDGKQLGKDMPFPPQMGLLLDTPLFLPQFSGYENLMLLMRVRKQNKEEKEILIHNALLQVGLTEQQHKKISHYSLGMRQRLGIAQALMEQPTFLILDEPFNGLDRDGVKQIRVLFQELREKGVTILLTSHYPEDLVGLCDTVTHLDGGRIVNLNHVEEE